MADTATHTVACPRCGKPVEWFPVPGHTWDRPAHDTVAFGECVCQKDAWRKEELMMMALLVYSVCTCTDDQLCPRHTKEALRKHPLSNG